MTNRAFYVRVAYTLAAYLEQELNLQRGIHFRFDHAVQGYKVLTLWLAANPAYTRRVISMTKELSQAARLEKGAFIRAEWGGGGVVELQVPKPRHLWRIPDLTKLPVWEGVKTAVGFDTENQIAWADFANPVTAHGLAAGLSGCGKSNLLRVLAFKLAVQNSPDEVQFLLFDVADSGLAWRGFEKVPHLVHGVIRDPKTAFEAMEWLGAEIERRAKERRTVPNLFIFVDEIQELSRERRFVEPTEAVARRGRKWGFNLILATQRPVKESLGSMSIKANLGLRLVGKTTSGQEAAWATDLPETGAEKLLEAGDFLLIKKGGQVQRVAIPLLTEDDLELLPSNGNLNRLDFQGFQDDEAQERILARLARDMQAEPGFDALETVLGLLAVVHGKGRPFLKNALVAEGRPRPGSGRTRRLLAWSREICRLLTRYQHRIALTAD